MEAPEIPGLGGATGGQKPNLLSLGSLPGHPSGPQPHWLTLPGTLCCHQTPAFPQPGPKLPLLSGSNTTLRKTLYVFQINAIKSIKVCE